MALTAEQQQRLDSLKAARERLVLGKSAVEVQEGNRRTRFAQTNLADLNSEIQKLEALTTSSTGSRRITPFFN